MGQAGFYGTRTGPGINFSGPGRPGKNMRSHQRAGPGVEDNEPGRVGPALCGPSRSLLCRLGNR